MMDYVCQCSGTSPEVVLNGSWETIGATRPSEGSGQPFATSDLIANILVCLDVSRVV